MVDIKLIQLTQEQLEELITNVVKETIENFHPIKADEEEYLNTDEACKFLKIGRTKLLNLKKHKNLPFIKTGGKLIFCKSLLREYLNSQIRTV